MSREPFGPWPIDVGALTPKQRETLYTDAVRRAHRERSEAIRLCVARVASMFKRLLGRRYLWGQSARKLFNNKSGHDHDGDHQPPRT